MHYLFFFPHKSYFVATHLSFGLCEIPQQIYFGIDYAFDFNFLLYTLAFCYFNYLTF